MIVVTGAGGQLGTAFASLLPEARLWTRRELDLSRPDGIEGTLAALGPTAVINCGAYTAVDRAEEETDLARTINAEAVAALARYTAAAGIPLVTFSTDYVFDGTATSPYLESAVTSPVNAYGLTKLEGEQLALSIDPAALVIRTSWLVSSTHPNFITTILRLAAERDELRVVGDQLGCPTVVDDFAGATLRALEGGASGVLHLTNAGHTTWYALARKAVEFAGMDPDVIHPCTTAEYPTPARRPAYSVLGSERRSDLGISELPYWVDSVRDMVGRIAKL